MKRLVPLPLMSALVLISCSNDATSPNVMSGDLSPQFHTVPDLTLTGSGTATVDGILSPGEWDGAGSVAFEATLPAAEGGGTTPAVLYVMNDAENLYLAVAVTRIGGTTNPSFEFDNDHNGVFDEGDDGIGMSTSAYETRFGDFFRTQEHGCPPASWCGFSDVDHGGSTDGAGAGTVGGGVTYTELAHPLDSADDLFDFSLAQGAIIGFNLFLRLETPNAEWPDGFGDTGFPGFFSSPLGYGHIVVSAVDPKTKDDCGAGGWKRFGFKNQGQCTRFVETGKGSR